mgnify:CR=1 FL=1
MLDFYAHNGEYLNYFCREIKRQKIFSKNNVAQIELFQERPEEKSGQVILNVAKNKSSRPSTGTSNVKNKFQKVLGT